MRENMKVYEAMKEAKRTNTKAAIATVIKVYGSSYRREGAKMYIDETDKHIGLISGGCLEPDVKEVAKKVLSTGTPLTKFYDMDEDLMWGLGLGCPGKVQVYIEPIT